MNLDTSKWVDRLVEISLKIDPPPPMETRAQRRMIADWIRDDCATRKMPPEEVETELERHGLK